MNGNAPVPYLPNIVMKQQPHTNTAPENFVKT